jgi:nucleoside-diphosphate-sugar epimerase
MQRCPLADEYRIADAGLPDTLAGSGQGQDVIISALGKAVSSQDKSKVSFQQVDFSGNVHILYEAQAASVKKFVYVSAFHAEKYPYLAY